MPKSSATIHAMPRQMPDYAAELWSCSLFGDQSEIEMRVPATGKWETIANVHSIAGVDAEDIAAFIIQAVNEYKRTRSIEALPRHAIGGLQ